MSTPLENRTHMYSVCSRLRALCPALSYKVEEKVGVDLRIVVTATRQLRRWANVQGDSWQNLLRRQWTRTRLADMQFSIIGDTISIHRPNSVLLRQMQEALWERASCITGDAMNRTAHAIARRRSIEAAETTLSTTVACLRAVSVAHAIAPHRRIYDTELVLSQASPLDLAAERRDKARKPLVLLFSCEDGLQVSASCDPGGLFEQTTLLATWLASKAHRTFVAPSIAVVPGRSFSDAVLGVAGNANVSPQAVYVASCYPLVSSENLGELSVLLSAPHPNLQQMLLRARGLLYLAYASHHIELVVSLDPVVFEHLEGGAQQNITVLIGALKQLLTTEFEGVFRRVFFTFNGPSVHGALFAALADHDGPSFSSYTELVNSRGWDYALRNHLVDEAKAAQLGELCRQHACAIRLFQPQLLDHLSSVLPSEPHPPGEATCLLAFANPYMNRDVDHLLVNSNLMGSIWSLCGFTNPRSWAKSLFSAADDFSLIEASNVRLFSSPDKPLALVIAPSQPYVEGQLEHLQINLFAIVASAFMHIYQLGHRDVMVQPPTTCSAPAREILLSAVALVLHDHFNGAFHSVRVAGQDVLYKPATLENVIADFLPHGAPHELANYLYFFAAYCLAGSPIAQISKLREVRGEYLALFEEKQQDSQLAFLQELGQKLQPLLQPFYRKAAQVELKKLLPQMKSVCLYTLAQLRELIATVRTEQALAAHVQEALSELDEICNQQVDVSLVWQPDTSAPFLLTQKENRCRFLPRQKRYNDLGLTELSNLLQSLSRRQSLFQHFFTDWLGEMAPRYFIDSQSRDMAGRLQLCPKNHPLLHGFAHWHSQSACQVDLLEAMTLLRAACPDGQQSFCETSVLKSLCQRWDVSGVSRLQVFFEQRTSLQWQSFAKHARCVYPAVSAPLASQEQIDAIHPQDEAGLGYLNATAFMHLAREAAPVDVTDALTGISVFLGRNGVLVEGGCANTCRTVWAAHSEKSAYFSRGHLRVFVASFSLWTYSLAHASELGLSPVAIKRSLNRLLAYTDDWEDHCPNGNAGRMLEVLGALSSADLLTNLWQAFFEATLDEAFQKAVASFSRGGQRESLLAAESSTFAATKAYLREELANTHPMPDPQLCESLPPSSPFHCLSKSGLLAYLEATRTNLVPTLSTPRYLERFATYVHSELETYLQADELSEAELLRLLDIPKAAPLWHPDLGWHLPILKQAVDLALRAALLRAGCCVRS